jgi:hypothetical protein
VLDEYLTPFPDVSAPGKAGSERQRETSMSWQDGMKEAPIDYVVATAR